MWPIPVKENRLNNVIDHFKIVGLLGSQMLSQGFCIKICYLNVVEVVWELNRIFRVCFCVVFFLKWSLGPQPNNHTMNTVVVGDWHVLFTKQGADT